MIQSWEPGGDRLDPGLGYEVARVVVAAAKANALAATAGRVALRDLNGGNYDHGPYYGAQGSGVGCITALTKDCSPSRVC